MKTKSLSHLSAVAKTAIFSLVAATLPACDRQRQGRQQQLTETIDSFATYYYNWHFHKAADYVTDDSRIWLSYMASQVSGNDLEKLNRHTGNATCETSSVVFENDSTASATIIVRDHLHMDSIGKEPSLRDKSTATVKIVYVKPRNKWLITLKEPLQDEKDEK